MSTITGLILDSGNTPITGVLRVQLNAPLVDELTTPDGYLTTIPHDFEVVDGVLTDCVLKESETSQIGYTFSLFKSATDYDYYYAGSGEFYTRNTDRPTHFHTDDKYYTGVAQNDDSVEVERVERPRLDPVGDAFQAIVPNQPSVQFAQLERAGFATDRLPQTARQIANLLTSNPLFIEGLIGRLIVQPYDNTRLWQRGNLAETGGSTYQCLIDNTIGFPPAANPTRWRLLAGKGDPGGTGGSNAIYGAGWDGDLNAPSKNAVYDYINAFLATKTELNAKAPLVSPSFSGAALYETQALGTGATASANKTRLATTEYAYAEAIERMRKQFISFIFIASSANPPQYTQPADGRTLLRSTYSELWAIANGTTGYGVGNGSTTFTLPDLDDPGTGLYYVVFTGV